MSNASTLNTIILQEGFVVVACDKPQRVFRPGADIEGPRQSSDPRLFVTSCGLVKLFVVIPLVNISDASCVNYCTSI